MRILLFVLSLFYLPVAIASDWQVLSQDLQLSDGEAQVEILLDRSSASAAEFDSDYDLEIRFTRETGQHSVGIFFPTQVGMASFDIDGWGQGLSGIQMVDGQDMRQYPNRASRLKLENGKQYVARVEVRKTSISAFINNRLVMQVQLEGKRLDIPEIWRVSRETLLGIGAWQSQTTVHQVRYRISQSSAVLVTSKQNTVAKSLPETDDISYLSDEFSDSSTLSNWKRVYQTEGTQADQLEKIDISKSRRGWLTLVPYSSSWYQDWRGVLMYKAAQGDFVVSTRIRASSRRGSGAPKSLYSLAGIMIRTPRNITPANWSPGKENYIFLSYGTANKPGQYQYEVKTTLNSDSQLEITNTAGDTAEIRVARIGDVFILLNKVNGRWSVHRRYHRSDMPDELQVGLTVYTDWNSVERLSPPQHNTTVIRSGSPDLIAEVDYMRFKRLHDLGNLKRTDLMTASDQELLQLLSFE